MTLFRFLDKERPDIEALVDAQDIQGLIRLLDHGNFDVQWKAANALGAMGQSATKPLLSVLLLQNVNVRLGAIEALAEIKDPTSIDWLVSILSSDENNEIRWAAALALGEIGDRMVIPYLVQALRDGNRYVRYGAAKGLEEMGWQPDNDADKVYYLIAVQDWNSVKKVGKPAIDTLTSMLKENDPAIRAKIVELLGDVGGILGQKACVTALKDADGNVRWRAVLSSKKCGVPINNLPWGLSKRPRSGPNPLSAAILNFFFFGLGYNYMGRWWGFLVFMSYMTLIVLAQLQIGPLMPFLIVYPVTALFATQTFVMAKRESEMGG